ESLRAGGKGRRRLLCLAVVVRGHVIGRVDTKVHRQSRELELRHVSFEPWFAAGAAAPAAAWGHLERERGLAGLAEAAWSLAAFTGAERVKVGKVTPPSLGA